uniref:RHS repeat-associated core domain-containing protein n=1 Tax=Streptacidiphilus melanogenes TaxID=411235 RepID=UPI0005A9BFF0
TSTGLVDIGARKYDPTTGRFISADPLFQPGEPQSIGGYAYAGDNPVSSSDPTGLSPTWQQIIAAVVALTVVVVAAVVAAASHSHGTSTLSASASYKPKEPTCKQGFHYNGHGCGPDGGVVTAGLAQGIDPTGKRPLFPSADNLYDPNQCVAVSDDDGHCIYTEYTEPENWIEMESNGICDGISDGMCQLDMVPNPHPNNVGGAGVPGVVSSAHGHIPDWYPRLMHDIQYVPVVGDLGSITMLPLDVVQGHPEAAFGDALGLIPFMKDASVGEKIADGLAHDVVSVVMSLNPYPSGIRGAVIPPSPSPGPPPPGPSASVTPAQPVVPPPSVTPPQPTP